MPNILLVIPCYNEADRLPTEHFAAFAARHDNVGFLFINDGSTDRTQSVIDGLANRNPSLFRSMQLDRNMGKAEAVRTGILEAMKSNPEYIGFWDADLATPLDELIRFADLYRRMPDKIMLAGARVKLMGRSIERRAVRHYLGRIFATAVSALLDIQMYDTQCGAKLFRCTPLIEPIFETSFHSRWLFDIELVLRIRRATAQNGTSIESRIYEVPLNAWRDVSGSKISYPYFAWAVFDLLMLRLRYRQWSRGRANPRT